MRPFTECSIDLRADVFSKKASSRIATLMVLLLIIFLILTPATVFQVFTIVVLFWLAIISVVFCYLENLCFKISPAFKESDYSHRKTYDFKSDRDIAHSRPQFYSF